jgi:hypothetical protein
MSKMRRTMSPTMGSIDRPQAPDIDTTQQAAPDLVRVGRSDGWRTALAAVLVVGLLLAVAVWKPWESDPAGARATTSSRVPASPEGGLLPAITTGPDGTHALAATPRPTPATLAALNLELMGTTDPHAAWGAAVAYVSRTQIDNAIARGSPTVTPVVSWELIEPGRSAPGPTLDHPGVASIAVAATWPAAIRPRAIRLFYVGPQGPGPSGGPVPSRAPSYEVDLGQPLATKVAVAAGQNPGLSVSSGAFYLTSFTRLGDPAAWIGSGWPSGAYQFQVVLDSGVGRVLPFTIGGSAGS